ncbi:TPA: hypothetical protein ACLQU7_001503 [Bacillus tropicus]|uniref:hypothetical protein n=1 Tax=Bacillus TaxID=1386 RepID=UPI0003184781|nr:MULTISPECIES: hypothetical protein [Bacillus]AIY76443.1 putative dNA polymerase I [Bacillus cereus]AJI06400.1 putative dNA polymerase I [Bacillus cereus G9241]PRP92305.1 hypothetical protein TUN_49390 [Bacillus sp. M21]
MTESSIDVIIQEDVSEEALTEQIEQINKMLKTEAQKKLEFIEFYLSQNLRLNIAIRTKEDLEYFLRSGNANEEIIMDIFDLLDQSFSRGYPQYVFEFTLNSHTTQQDFFKAVNEGLPKQEKISIPEENVIVTRIGNIDFTEGDLLTFKIEYEKFKTTHRRSMNQQRVSDIRSTFPITFDFQKQLCYIHCGERKIANSIERLLLNYIIGVFSKFSSFSLKDQMTSTEFYNEFSLSKQTVIILDYLEEEINNEEYNISDYFGIYFSNSRGDKVKSVRLRGSNLLESYEVAERIRNGDQIKAVRFQLMKKLPNENYIISTVLIDFSCPLKITFTNLDNTNYMIDIIHHLRQALTNSLNKVYKEEQIKERLTGIMTVAKIKESAVIHELLSELKYKFEQLEVDIEDKDKFLKILDSYRVGG